MNKNQNSKIEKNYIILAIEKALKDQGAIRPDMTAKMLLDNTSISDDGEVVYTSAIGDEMSIGDGVKLFLQDNPAFIKAANVAPASYQDVEDMSAYEYRQARKSGALR